jgi:hypothetical protein
VTDVADALNRVADELHDAGPAVVIAPKPPGRRLQTLFWFIMVCAAVVLLLQVATEKINASEDRAERRGRGATT